MTRAVDLAPMAELRRPWDAGPGLPDYDDWPARPRRRRVWAGEFRWLWQDCNGHTVHWASNPPPVLPCDAGDFTCPVHGEAT